MELQITNDNTDNWKLKNQWKSSEKVIICSFLETIVMDVAVASKNSWAVIMALYRELYKKIIFAI